MTVVTEKQIFRDILKQYEELPCLWNPSHASYNNKVARKQAYSELVEKYKLYEPDSTYFKLKKKIENMRTTYKRERKKVLICQRSNGTYEPTLWYYENFKFLDVIFAGKESTYLEQDDLDEDVLEQEPQEDNKLKAECTSPPTKRRNMTSIFLTEGDHEHDHDSEPSEEPYLIKNDQCTLKKPDISEADLFGRTIGQQLRELNPMQKFIAEKLISDVIFYGRLEKLKTGACINFDGDRY